MPVAQGELFCLHLEFFRLLLLLDLAGERFLVLPNVRTHLLEFWMVREQWDKSSQQSRG